MFNTMKTHTSVGLWKRSRRVLQYGLSQYCGVAVSMCTAVWVVARLPRNKLDVYCGMDRRDIAEKRARRVLRYGL